MNKTSLLLSLIGHTAVAYCLLSFGTVNYDKSIHRAKLPIIEFVLDKSPSEKRSVLGVVAAKPRIDAKDLEISTYDDSKNNLNIDATDTPQSFTINEVQLNKNDGVSSLLGEASTSRVTDLIKQVSVPNKNNVIKLVKKTQAPPMQSAINDISLSELLEPLDLKMLSRPLSLSKPNENMLLKQSFVPKKTQLSKCNVVTKNVTNKKLNSSTINRILRSNHLTITGLIGSQQLQLRSGSQLNISQLLNTRKNYQIKATNKSFSVAQLLAFESKGQNQSEFYCSD